MPINPMNQTSQPFNTLLDKGSFSLAFCTHLAQHLDPKSLGALAQVNKRVHHYLTLRTPTLGAHPIVPHHHHSSLETAYFDYQDKRLAPLIQIAKTRASKKMKRYLPLITHLTDSVEIKSRLYRHQYRGVMGAIADLRGKHQMLNTNPYLNEQERTKETNRLHQRFRHLQQESFRIEYRTKQVLLHQQDTRTVHLGVV